jgi:hypothetical protein
MRWAGHVAGMGEKRNAYRVLVGKPEGKNWEEQDVGGWTILKWILREIGWNGVDWIEMAQDRFHWRVLVNPVLNLRVP